MKYLSSVLVLTKMTICEYNAISLIPLAKNIHNEITSLQLLKRCCTVSSCWLQFEQKVVVLTFNWKSLWFKYNTLFRILYWKDLKEVFLGYIWGRRYMSFQSRFRRGNKVLKYCCDVGVLIFWEIIQE